MTLFAMSRLTAQESSASDMSYINNVLY